MAGPDLSALSSNWKILQKRLQATNKQEQENGVKRKRAEPEKSSKSKTASNGYKRPKFSSTNTDPVNKRRKMGSYLSSTTATASPSLADKKSTLINTHDIDPAAISAAYGSSTSTTTHSHSDEINGGLHPTHKIGKYIALDCEMVGTGPPPHTDNILARASLVNFHGEQIYDSYVQAPPKTRVEDYRTFVSGIKPHHMRPPLARPFAQVQADVAKLLEGRVLVGHALRNDLNALMLSYPKRDLRDTSRHPKFRVESRGKPPALRKLAKSELGMEIQTGEHSSVEDARAAMMLFKKEKAGFEEENRKHFGTRGKVVSGKGREVTPSVDEEEDVEEEEDDLDLLDGEDGEELGDEEAPTKSKTAQPKAKKRKKKKRTKRT